jgi:hypothetical protein
MAYTNNKAEQSLGPVDALRLTAGSLQDVVDELERQDLLDPANNGEGRRQFTRFAFRPARAAQMDVGKKGSVSGSYIVFARNISTAGMSIIHGVYIHPGTRCIIRIADARGKPCEIPAEIKRCRHVMGRAHEIGVKFDGEVDPAGFVGDVTETAGAVDFDPATFVRTAVQLAENAKAGVPRDQLLVLVESLAGMMGILPRNSASPQERGAAKIVGTPEPIKSVERKDISAAQAA